MALVNGYQFIFAEINELKEQLFAKYEDGTILTCIREYSPCFYSLKDKWTLTDKINKDALPIGKYNMPNLKILKINE